jgi:hypothetical protein
VFLVHAKLEESSRKIDDHLPSFTHVYPRKRLMVSVCAFEQQGELSKEQGIWHLFHFD